MSESAARSGRGVAAEADYRALVERAQADPCVVGVVVFGSRAAGPFVTDRSDVDTFVIVAGSPDDARRWSTPHGSPVEVWAMTLEAFRTHALPGDPDAWNRPALIRARVDLDKLDGGIAALVDRKRRLEPQEARVVAATALDGAINSMYRALRNSEGGRPLAGQLDGLETIGPLLTAAFALEGRVRPFNKWLEFEIEEEPLVSSDLACVVEFVREIAADPRPDRLRAAFQAIERAARAAGHGAVIDSLEPDVPWLRGVRHSSV